MSSLDFRQIAARGNNGRAERLLRAAISAFCALTRPSKREITQIEDLALPLLDMVSADARRFAAAALSECEDAPANLVLRLADEPVGISAPLLIRSRALSDIDLIALIGRHGAAHARAIARRPTLNVPVARLIDTLLRPDNKEISAMPELAAISRDTAPDEKAIPAAEVEPADEAPRRLTAEEVRGRLRAMMHPNRPGLRFENRDGAVFDEGAGSKHYEKLRTTALTGVPAFFQTALADALNIDFAKARSLTETGSYSYLMVALRALDLDEAQAFLLTAAVFPSMFGHPETIRLFLERYTVLHRDAALEQVGYWKVDALARSPNRPSPARSAQKPGGAPVLPVRTLKAS